MKISKGLFIILILPVLLSFISAQQLTFDSYLETADIESGDNIHETMEVFLNINGSQNFIDFSLSPRIQNLNVSLDSKEINCSVKEVVGASNVNCQFPDYFTGKHHLKIEFDSSYPLIKLKDRLMFRSGYNPVIETNKFIYVLKLPLGYAIPQESAKDQSFFVSPDPDLIYSDGQRVILKWEEKTLSEKFDVSVIFEKITKSFNLWLIFLIFALVLGMIILFLYFKRKIKQEKVYFFQKKAELKKKKKSKVEVLEEHLIGNEKKIVDELRNADKRELWQKQLQLKTEFSKAKLSRVIANLESRKIIQKIPFGNTNKIKLKIS